MKSHFIAQSLNIGGQNIKGPLQGINNLGDLVNKVIPLLVSVAAIILFFVLVWGGYDFLLSQGDAGKVKSAKAKITTGLIGFILLILSYFIARTVSTIFGIGEGIF